MDEIDATIATWSGWIREGTKLRKTYRFESFAQALAFMVAVGVEAERMDHHPEWTNVHRKVFVTLTTHDVDGLTHKDLELARIMDRYAV